MNHDRVIPDAQLANEMERVLTDDLASSWFPRVLDPRGGYFENFDHQWQHARDDRRSLVHQARLAWSAARFAEHDSIRRDEFAAYALHGLKFIRDVMCDSKYGGFYFEVAVDGTPLWNGDKHAYPAAFALFAAARVLAVTNDEVALDVAGEAMRWLARLQRRDSTFVEAVRRDSTPIRAGDTPKFPFSLLSRGRRDCLGEPFGAVTLNTHLHILEAYLEIHHVIPDENSRRAVQSLLMVISERFFDGERLRAYISEDLPYRQTPAGYGHTAETAYLLLEAHDELAAPSELPLHTVANTLAQHVRMNGIDREAGGTFNEPADRGKKIWWVQAETLNLLLTMHAKTGTTFAVSDWRSAAVAQWIFIRDHILDKENGGWIKEVGKDGSRLREYPKSSRWVDPYHNTRALARGISILRNQSLQQSR